MTSDGRSPAPDRYLALSAGVVLRNLETPALYDTVRDELYELSPDAFAFLAACAAGEPAASAPGAADAASLVATLLSERLAAITPDPPSPRPPVAPSPRPSLRYLELLLTDRCNLRCRHCYLGDPTARDLPFELALSALGQFAELQGLRLLLSGGEPLLYPRWWELNERLRDLPLRPVLLTNGVLVTGDVARRLRVREAQVSLDGMREGHDALRGPGSFDAARAGIAALAEAGIPVSVATMVHARNLAEFDDLARLVEELEAAEWNLDVPCRQGRLAEEPSFTVAPEVAGRYLREYGFGGGPHGSAAGHSCGAHLAAVLPDGRVAKCGFFPDLAAGSLREESLAALWLRVPRWPLADLRCHCPQLDECRGGCRFRARTEGDILGPDPFQCQARGVVPP